MAKVITKVVLVAIYPLSSVFAPVMIYLCYMYKTGQALYRYFVGRTLHLEGQTFVVKDLFGHKHWYRDALYYFYIPYREASVDMTDIHERGHFLPLLEQYLEDQFKQYFGLPLAACFVQTHCGYFVMKNTNYQRNSNETIVNNPYNLSADEYRDIQGNIKFNGNFNPSLLVVHHSLPK